MQTKLKKSNINYSDLIKDLIVSIKQS